MSTQRTWILATAAALVLAACGGSDDAPPALVSIATAQRNLFEKGGSWTLTGKAPDGSSYTMSVAVVPLAPAATIASGATYPRTQQTFGIVQGGTTVSSGGPTYSFDAASLAIVQSDNGDGTCSLATSNTALPASAVVGAGGDLYALSDLTGCSGSSNIVGSTTTAWSLERDSGVVLLCSNSTSKDLSGQTVATLSLCVQTASDGSIGTKALVTLSAFDMSTSARNF